MYLLPSLFQLLFQDIDTGKKDHKEITYYALHRFPFFLHKGRIRVQMIAILVN